MKTSPSPVERAVIAGTKPFRIEAIDCLRGIASLSVCWFHLTSGNASFLQPGLLKLSGAYGWIGVEVFFVISGFILPYAMYSAGYRLSPRQYRNFLLRRIVRLDPPYFAAVLLAIVLAYVSFWLPGYRGAPPDIGLARTLFHVAYLNTFFHYEWLNPVFWSLAIELQYYLLIGLTLPLVASRNRAARYLGLFCFACLSLIPVSNAFLCYYVFLFVMGILAFQYRSRLVQWPEALLLLGASTAGSSLKLGLAITATGVVTSCIIMFTEWRNPILAFFGNISYSLYLVHVPVGARIVNLGTHFHGGDIVRASFLFAGFAASIGAAFLMYRFIEKPSQNWAKAIGLRPISAPVLLTPQTVLCD